MVFKPITQVSIDTSTICQLKCPECSTAKGIIKNGVIKAGFLNLDNFKQFLDHNPNIKQIELSNWGEIFLNPNIYGIMEFSYNYGVELTAGNGTNFNNVNDMTIEALVKFKFKYINISIDGASQETYSKYRINGIYDNVINNIKKLNYFKQIYNSPYPKLSWQFIIFGHNEYELPKVKALCKELNMVYNPKLNHSLFSPVVDKEFVRKESGLNVASREEFKIKNDKPYKRPCCQLMFSPQINWNGDLLGCCVNKWVTFGNVFRDGFSNCLSSDLYRSTISILLGKESINNDIPCFHCPTYSDIKDKPISENELQEYASFIHPAETI